MPPDTPTVERGDTMPTATQAQSTATEAVLPSRLTVRWYQIILIVLSLALAAVTALAVYQGEHNPTNAVPATNSETVHPGTVTEYPCYPLHPC